MIDPIFHKRFFHSYVKSPGIFPVTPRLDVELTTVVDGATHATGVDDHGIEIHRKIH